MHKWMVEDMRQLVEHHRYFLSMKERVKTSYIEEILNNLSIAIELGLETYKKEYRGDLDVCGL